MADSSRLLTARTVRFLDIGVIVWIAVWIGLGVLVWHDVNVQSQLSQNVVKTGAAIKDTGQALGVVGGIPLVGSTIGGFAKKIEATGADVATSGAASTASIKRIAVVAGIGTAVLPAALILILYLPLRLGWRRDAGAIRTALPAEAGDPAFEQYLAHRAATSLTWDRVRALTDDPWKDIHNGDYRRLADAELGRLGLKRPS